jgi:hypothetical protein
MDRDKDGIDDCIENLKRLPSSIESQILIKKIEDAIMENLKNKIAI